MDKNAKALIKYLSSHGGCDKFIFFGSSGFESLASELGVGPESLRSTVRYLHDCGYIDYQKIHGSDKNASFSLSHKGENWKYFRRLTILNYISEKWIDFLAVIVSVVSLIVSVISALSK